MENVTKVLIKEVRRVRALIELAEENKVPFPQGVKELNSLRRILAMVIKHET
jgi:hypothetical protein